MITREQAIQLVRDREGYTGTVSTLETEEWFAVILDEEEPDCNLGSRVVKKETGKLTYLSTLSPEDLAIMRSFS